MDDREPDDIEHSLRRLVGSLGEVYGLRLLSPEERAEVRRLEETAEAGGAAGGLMPFVNEGIWEALQSDAVYAVTTGPMTSDPPVPWTIMKDEDDQVIGEWLPSSRIEAARDSKRCIFLSTDFVLYKDRRSRGRSRFVMPYVCLPLEEDESRFSVCGLGSPSVPADEYLRSLMGSPGTDVATLVLGVCFGDSP